MEFFKTQNNLPGKEEPKISFEEYLNGIVDNTVKIEVNNLFLKNPYLMHNSLEISQMIEQNPGLIEKNLEELIEMKILDKIGEGEKSIYSLSDKDLDKIRVFLTD